MKVSIITMHYIRNYGSVLQTYATQTKLCNMGYETEVVNYIRPNCKPKVQMRTEWINSQYRKSKMAVKSIYHLYRWINNQRVGKTFDAFLKKNVSLSKRYESFDDLVKDPPEADIFCTGSDQMWNSIYNDGVLPEYFLEFAPKGKTRVAYSVSVGRTKLDEDELDQTAKLIKHYSAISVREKTAVPLLERMGYPNAEWVQDPTLILSHEDWKPLIAPHKHDAPYVLVYQLYQNSDMEKFAEKIALDNGIKVIRIVYSIKERLQHGRSFFVPPVSKWLSLFEHASYVVTDSFHGTAFSINFNKRFFVFYPQNYSTRLQSLLELTGQTHRAIEDSSVDWHTIQDTDYEQVNEILDREREKAEQFITKYFR